MTPEVKQQPVTSASIDVYLNLGIALENLQRAVLDHPNLEVRLCNGMITLYRDGEPFARYGIAYVPLTGYDWSSASAGFVGD